MTSAPASAGAAGHETTAEGAEAPSLRVLVRLVLGFAAWTFTLWSIVGIFVWRDIPGGWGTLALGALLATSPIIVFARGLHDDSYPSAAIRVLVMRPFWYAQITALALAGAALLGALLGLIRLAPLAGGRIGVLLALPLLALLFAAGYWGSRRLVVREMSFTFPDLPPGFDGLRIAQLSDLHVGPHTPRRFLARIVSKVEASRADLIAITGDQVDDFDRDVEHFVRAFGTLRAPLGVYAIAGNHDVYAGWDDVHRGLESAGICVLVNDAVPLTRGPDTLWLGGTGDPAAIHSAWGGGATHAAPDIPRTLAAIPSGAFSVVLAHNPALWPALANGGVQLTLSGHTHHGQISIPFLRWCLASPFLEHAMGDYEHRGSRLYINPGTNYWGLPLRLGAWPEITIVTLRRA